MGIAAWNVAKGCVPIENEKEATVIENFSDQSDALISTKTNTTPHRNELHSVFISIQLLQNSTNDTFDGVVCLKHESEDDAWIYIA